MSQGEHSACLRDSLCHSVSFVCDKTPLADPGAIAAYECVLCSTLIYKCAESFCCVSLFGLVCGVCVCVYVCMCVCVCMMKQRKKNVYVIAHTRKCVIAY